MPRAQAEGIQNRPARKAERLLMAIASAAALVGVAGVRAAAVALLVSWWVQRALGSKTSVPAR